MKKVQTAALGPKVPLIIVFSSSFLLLVKDKVSKFIMSGFTQIEATSLLMFSLDFSVFEVQFLNSIQNPLYSNQFLI